MNKVKEGYKLTIVDFIIDLYMELHDEVSATQGCIEEHELNQQKSALKFMRNLVKTITAESDEEITERIRNHNTGRKRK